MAAESVGVLSLRQTRHALVQRHGHVNRFNFAASESQAYFEPLVSLPRSYIQASFWPHLWVFKQAGHSSGNLRSDSELSLIFSVVRPVETILLVFGHRIIISGIL